MNEYQAAAFEAVKQQAAESFHSANPVVKVFESLGEYVKNFEADLDEDHELGARLVTFGNSLTFHVQDVSYSLPSLITFFGVTDSGDKVQLVQHISQLSFLLIAVKKLKETPKRIGFIWDDASGA